MLKSHLFQFFGRLLNSRIVLWRALRLLGGFILVPIKEACFFLTLLCNPIGKLSFHGVEYQEYFKWMSHEQITHLQASVLK